jgi:HEPN domain-containing protein
LPSPEQREFASLLLRKAEGDVEVVRALVGNASITDDAIGFHAQQAIEKAMKAVFAIRGVRFPRTHDLGFLLELATVMACASPTSSSRRAG